MCINFIHNNSIHIRKIHSGSDAFFMEYPDIYPLILII